MERGRSKLTRSSEDDKQECSAVPRWASYAGRLGLAIVILLVAGAIAAYWLTNRPKAQRKPPESQATLVEVSSVAHKTHQVMVRAMGTVVPARSIQLTSRVGGEIVEVSPEFVPGGRFERGQKILRIDPKDYELAVEQRASELAKAQSELKLEMGQQSIARREYKLLGQEVESGDEELLLRKPQLESTKAAVSSAKAAYEQAGLNLRRTELKAPFNAMVQSREIDIGAQVSVGAPLASLVGTAEYWVQVSVPVDQLTWIDIPGVIGATASTVRVLHETSSGEQRTWAGSVERLMPSLETQGRMAQLLVSVKDPLGLEAPVTKRYPLILDSYVRVEIAGHTLEGIAAIKRTSLRDGNRVWVMLSNNTLDIREVRIAWGGDDVVYISEGLEDGELLVTSDIAAPVKGSTLRTAAPSPGSSPARSTINQQPSDRQEG